VTYRLAGPYATKHNQPFTGGLIMSEDTITVSKSFYKDLEYKIQRLTLIADKLDLLAFDARQFCYALDRAYKNASLEKKE
jgi:hypothetical protein